MRTVGGRYDGNVVFLDEPIPVTREVKVTVQFPEEEGLEEGANTPSRRWNWDISRAREDSLRGTVTEELFRQRQGE